MEKLVVCIMGQNCKKFIGMCLESVKDADAIVYCDGGSTDGTLDMVQDFINDKIEFNDDNIKMADMIENPYDQEDKTMNGKQRNFYLQYLKKHYQGYYCLCLDADEVVDDLNKLKEWINKYGNVLTKRHPCIHVKMRHFIGDLGHEDATVPEHMCLNRLFKIVDDLEYPEVEHPVLSLKGLPIVPENVCRVTTIWHMAYIPNLWEIKKRYDSHMKKSNMHTPEFLNQWYRAHLFGQYPTTQINLIDIPKIILDEFGIDKDEIYFMNRGLETKHFIDATHWKDFFKCKDAVEYGCGRGPRVFAMNGVGVHTIGFEISYFAVKNKIHEYVMLGDICNSFSSSKDLVIGYDVLEHISYQNLDKAINVLVNATKKYIIVSVPVIGDPNLEADPTHIIRETKEWWIKQFTDKGLKLIKTPEHFLFKEQIMIFKK